MRIVSGEFGGRLIAAPKGLNTRPTADKVREALFSILGRRVADVHVLDLFAGSGAMGLEALSRGGSDVVFVDADRNAVKTIRENIASLKVEKACTVMATDWRQAIRRLQGRQFGLILLDPPYQAGLYENAVNEAMNLLSIGGVLVIECDKMYPPAIDERYISDKRIYGRTMLLFIEKEGEA